MSFCVVTVVFVVVDYITQEENVVLWKDSYFNSMEFFPLVTHVHCHYITQLTLITTLPCTHLGSENLTLYFLASALIIKK